MDTVNEILEWLNSHEGVLSALAALAAIIGISFGILAFIFPSFGRVTRRWLGHTPETSAPVVSSRPAKAKTKPTTFGVDHFSIAVLPLQTLTESENDRNMAVGISAEIISDLAQVPEIRVASRLATAAFHGNDVSLSEVAEVLKVHFVLTGSFQHQGEHIRLMVELTNAFSGEQIWAETYDRELQDLFAVQAEVSIAIVAAIGGELKLATTRTAFEAPTRRLDAWGLVQKAFNFWLTTFTPEDYELSISLLRKAVTMDPQYAGARASLAQILSQRYIEGLSQDSDADRKESLAMIEEAYRLAPRDLTVLGNAGLVWTHHGFGRRAQKTLRAAVEMAPLDLITMGYLGFNLAWTGDDDGAEEAVEILDRLLSIAPRHPSRPYWNFFKATAHVRLGQLDEARACAREVLDQQPMYYLAWLLLANIYGRQNAFDKARDATQRAVAINPMLPPKRIAERMRTLCMSEERTEPFISGYRSAGLLE